MDNFDLRKFLAEGKLHEASSPQDIAAIADRVAEEFTKESADEGDFLTYSVGKMDGMRFELDTETTSQSPDSIDPMGVGEGWGGMFSIKPTEDGHEVRNSEKGGLVAMIDAMGNFRMLSADESRAEMGLEEAEEEVKEYSSKIKKSELKEMIKAAMLAEAEGDDEDEEEIEVEDEVDVDADVEDETEEIDIEDDAQVELTGDTAAISDNLEAALEAARALGDEKLVDQIGNTITFFTRAHIVK